MGGYKLPDWKKSIGQNKYEVEIDGQTFVLPKFEYLIGDQAIRLEQAGSIEGGLYTVLDEICEGLGTAFKPVPLKYAREFLKAWQKDSALDEGESDASDDS
jgi:hypothetical protein